MKYCQFILCLCLLVFSGTVYGQKGKSKKFKGKRQSSQSLLNQAKKIKEKSPTKAIALVEEAITYARKDKDRQVEGNAYVLLGSIYEQIDQKDLALQRYQQALPFIGRSKKDRGTKAPVYERMGQIYLSQGNDNLAENNFTLCIEESNDKVLTLRCEEGLADVQLLRKDSIATTAILGSIVQNYDLDSIELARNEARRSQVLLQQNKYSEASDAYLNSINTLPQTKEIDKDDYKPIQKAQDDLLNFKSNSGVEKIELRSNIANKSKFNVPIDEQVSENLKIATLFEAENNFPEAEKFIKASKTLITPKTDAAVAAEVYKKSSKFNQQKGRVDAALDDLELYISAKESAIQNLERDLKEQVEIVKGQQQIDLNQRNFDLEEKEKDLLQSQLYTQKVIIGLLSLVLIGSMVFFYFLYKNVKAKRKANQRLLLKSLRTQMNPHFIFNALNSVNNFIAKSDEKAANKFLSEFSRLMRKVLDYSQKDFIAFEEEIELNELYLKLEHFRFRDKFDYTFQNNASQHGYGLEVPPMLIQPFIENAVWHGLRYKEDQGHLEVTVNENENFLIVTIKDDGIGRKKSKALKTDNQKKYKSTGLDNVARRVALINDIYEKNYEILVSDVNGNEENTGTVVEIKIPVK